MVSSFVTALAFFIAGKMGHHVVAYKSLIITIMVTTIVWVTVTFLTEPTDRKTLVSFYRLVRPAGPGWTDVRAEAGVGSSPDSLAHSILGWVLGCLFIYSALFGTGSFIYGKTAQGSVFLAVFIVSGFGLIRLLPKLWAAEPASTS